MAHRSASRTRLRALSETMPLTLARAKQMQDDFRVIEGIDRLKYSCSFVGEEQSWVNVQSPEGVALVGDDKVMNALFVNTNARIAEITILHERAIVERFQALVAEIP